ETCQAGERRRRFDRELHRRRPVAAPCGSGGQPANRECSIRRDDEKRTASIEITAESSAAVPTRHADGCGLQPIAGLPAGDLREVENEELGTGESCAAGIEHDDLDGTRAI